MPESYLHKMAKELLFHEIIDKQKFHYKLYSDEWSIPLKKKDIVCMECPVVIGEIDAHQTIKNRGYYYPEVETCDYNETATPTKRCSGIIDTDGYCGCVCCDHMVFKGVVFHDIAVINTGNVEFAIEIINKHKTQWLINMEPAYRVYLINANNILQRISDSAVYVNSFTTPYLREPIHEKEI